MLKVSDEIRKNTFKLAIFGYVGLLISLIFYYFDITPSLLQIIAKFIMFMMFPLSFIMILATTSQYPKPTRKELEQMDINTYLKPMSSIFKDKPSWLMLGLSLTLMYSFISFFYWLGHSSGGVPTIEHGEYCMRNHSLVKIITSEKYYELKRYENIGTISHVLSFYAIIIWMLYKKEYVAIKSNIL